MNMLSDHVGVVNTVSDHAGVVNTVMVTIKVLCSINTVSDMQVL